MRKNNIWNEAKTDVGQHLNREDFPSFDAHDPKVELVNVLMTGTTGNKFYASGKRMTNEYIEVIKKIDDPEFLAKAILYARLNGFMREVPIAALVHLSSIDPTLYRKVYHKVLRTPRDWDKFVSIARSGAFRKGLGKAIKKTMIEALSSMSIYHAIKYPKPVKDMIRLSRPSEEVNPAIIKFIMEKDPSTDETLKVLSELPSMSESEVVEAIRKYRLPFEAVMARVKPTPAIYEALLYNAPYMNLIMNLHTFYRAGVFSKQENIEYAAKRIADPDNIKNSMLFPYRYFIAYNAFKRNILNAESKDEMIPILSALKTAIEQSVSNVPSLNGTVLIALDISWSMRGIAINKESIVTYSDIASIFAGSILKRNPDNTIVIPFRDHVEKDIGVKFTDIIQSHGIIEATEYIRNISDDGTSLSAPIEHALKNDIHADTIVAITDNEEWVGRPFINALQEYLQKHPKTQVYLITISPYRDYPTPTNHSNVHYIFGWSDKILTYIGKTHEDMLTDIENYPL